MFLQFPSTGSVVEPKNRQRIRKNKTRAKQNGRKEEKQRTESLPRDKFSECFFHNVFLQFPSTGPVVERKRWARDWEKQDQGKAERQEGRENENRKPPER